MKNKKNIENQVKNIIADIAGCDVDEIRLEHNLTHDIGLDSLDAVDAVIRFEEMFDIETIPDEDIAKWDTVFDIVEYLKKKTNKK